jgi:hypothetical protein
MPCFKPLQAYSPKVARKANGKRIITFDVSKGADKSYESMVLPCGQCIGCRISKSREWAIRCVHEASQYDFNCFLTLTYCRGQSAKHFDCDHKIRYNPTQTLIKSDLQKFLKRFRKKYSGFQGVYDEQKNRKMFPIRYFACGEYGENLQHPHFHLCVFNFDFTDKELWNIKNGVRLYRSASLEKLWPFGFSTIGAVNAVSAAYVARYCIKKINGDMSYSHYNVDVDPETGEMIQLEPEFITMSRRPGIGRGWLQANHEDLYPKDFITNDGSQYKPPRYYDKVFESYHPEIMETVKKKRKELNDEHKLDLMNSYERLAVREKVLKKKITNLERMF